MTKLILSLLNYSLSIFDYEQRTKYQNKLYNLEKEYDDEIAKNKPDRNKLDHIERDVLRIGQLVDTEIKRSKVSGV